MNHSAQDIKNMSYVDFMAFLDETNRPPGGKNSVRKLAQNSFLDRQSLVLDVGCNTGYCTFELARLAKCGVVGVDISESMIKKAKKFQQQDPDHADNISFETGDAQALRFEDNTFDLVMSGGSTVFVPDRGKAFSEYSRVCKNWGFIGDIIFYYREKPPSELLDQMNDLMGIVIEPWTQKYWTDFYDKTGLEMYYSYTGKMQHNTEEKIRDYVKYMSQKNTQLNREEQEAVYEKLLPIMRLFNENHKYLDYGVFIMRKRCGEYEPSLFAE